MSQAIILPLFPKFSSRRPVVQKPHTTIRTPKRIVDQPLTVPQIALPISYSCCSRPPLWQKNAIVKIPLTPSTTKHGLASATPQLPSSGSGTCAAFSVGSRGKGIGQGRSNADRRPRQGASPARIGCTAPASPALRTYISFVQLVSSLTISWRGR